MYIAEFAQILEILNSFKPTSVQKFPIIKIYNPQDVPVLLYGSEIRTLGKKTTKRLTLTKIKFFRTAGYTLLNHKRKRRNFGRVESKTS